MPAIPQLLFDPGASHPFTDTEHCTGVLLDPTWVLTAQHCTNLNEQQGHPFQARNVTVTFTRIDGSKEVRKVSQIQRAPGYLSGSGIGDIALLKLSTPVADISPLPLLASGQSGSLTTVQRFGWGITSPSETKPSSVLRYSVEGVWHQSNVSDLGIKIAANCSDFSWPSQYALWTYGTGQGGMAKGDSGGPVIDDISPGSYAVAGITSSSLDLRNCNLHNYNTNTLGNHYLGLSNRVDQGGAEWSFINGLVPDVGVPPATGWTATRAGLPTGADPSQGVTINSVSCPTTGSCTAAGFYDGSYGGPLLETLSGGSWSATQPPLPPDAYRYNQAAGLTSVSCADSSTCIAVGSYEDANTDAGLIESGASGNWSAIRAPLPAGTTGDPFSALNTVTCLSDTLCIALGSYAPSGFEAMIDTLTSQGWQSVTAPLPADASATDPNSSLQSLSCATPSSCIAVGSYIAASGNTEGVIEKYDGGAWTAAKVSLPPDAATSGQYVTLSGVACPAVGSCAAAGSYSTSNGQEQGFLSRLSNGAWSTVEAPLPADASATDPAVIFGEFAGFSIAAQSYTRPVACSASAACIAVGTYIDSSNVDRPLIEQLANNSWTAVPVAFPPGYASGDGYLNSAVCLANGECIASGSAAANGNRTALMDALNTGNWAAIPVTLPPDSASTPSAFLWDTDCTASVFCAAIGGYYANDNTNQGMLMTSG